MSIDRPQDRDGSTFRFDEQPAFARWGARLSGKGLLAPRDMAALGALPARRMRLAAHRRLLTRGDVAKSVLFVVDGIVARCEELGNGRRQFGALHLAGDVCEPVSLVQHSASAALLTLSGAEVVEIERTHLMSVMESHPRLALAFLWEGERQAAIASRWLLIMSRRSGEQRLGHLLCEIGIRLERVGEGDRHRFALSATQVQIADMLGLTSVHVNRMLRGLRENGLVTATRSRVTVHDWPALARSCGFRDDYLT